MAYEISTRIDEEDVARAIKAGDLDLTAILTAVLSDEDDLKDAIREMQCVPTASEAEYALPNALRDFAAALEEAHKIEEVAS